MKTLLCAALVGVLLLTACGKKKPSAANSAADTLTRAKITFILGKDENPRNPYYSLADDYYRLNDSDKTEIVIDTIYSLSGVLHYLTQYHPMNGYPWGTVNLVSHGNEFIDLSVQISPYGPRVSEESIRAAIADTVLRPLDTTIVDRQTLINLHGCAVGKNIGLLRMLGVAFGGRTAPRVKASKLFEYYSNISQNNNPQFVKHYYAKVWYAFYQPDSIPDDSMLAAQFKSHYPNDAVNWYDAVTRYHPATPAEEYNIRMFIPVVWEDFYESKQQMPDVRTTYKQNKWVQEKPEFQALMDKSGIPRENFQIKFFNASYSNDSGTFYALRVKARAGVTCVIKPLLRNDAAMSAEFPPYVPLAMDTDFFGFAGQSLP